jgi:hypothetical protein
LSPLLVHADSIPANHIINNETTAAGIKTKNYY